MHYWLDDVKSYLDYELEDTDIVVILAGTKADLGDAREVDRQRAEVNVIDNTV